MNILCKQGVDAPADSTGAQVIKSDFPNWILTPQGDGREPWEGVDNLAEDTWDYARFVSGAESMFVWGHIEYEDVFGTLYVRRFCYRRTYHDREDTTAEYGGSRYNYEERVRRRGKFERWLRSEVLLRLKHGFRHPAGPRGE